jgi:hypothetical protein
MKAYTLIATFLMAMPVLAQQAAQQPAQPVAQTATQQQTGHILSAETHKSHHTTSVCMAGFAGARRPHPGRHTATPAAFR